MTSAVTPGLSGSSGPTPTSPQRRRVPARPRTAASGKPVCERLQPPPERRPWHLTRRRSLVRAQHRPWARTQLHSQTGPSSRILQSSAGHRTPRSNSAPSAPTEPRSTAHRQRRRAAQNPPKSGRRRRSTAHVWDTGPNDTVRVVQSVGCGRPAICRKISEWRAPEWNRRR